MLKIKVNPGWILVTPYIAPYTLTSAYNKELSGESQKSVVIAIGEDLIDDNGIERTPNCEVDDVIIHKYISEDFDIDNTKMRFVHFSDVRGIWESAPKIEEKK